MIKFILSFFLALSLSWAIPAMAAKEKVLLDSDMVEAFDDGVAMLLLAAAPNVDLVGVTTLSGNSWVEQGTAYALYQLDQAGFKDIPVAQGLVYPLRPNRHEGFAIERKSIGRGHDGWVGSFNLPKPTSWEAAYVDTYKASPTLKPINKHAVDFIIDTVRANPHEITVAAIGPCGNLALAVRKAPDIIPLIKRVIYMGGAFFQPGNITPAAEFNWFFDPEAAKIAVRSPFKEQIVLGLDVCEKVVFTRENYDRLLKTLGSHPLASILRKTFVGQSFGKDPKFTFFVRDVLVAAVIIDPTLITDSITTYIDVCDQVGQTYGQSLAYVGDPPFGAQKAVVVKEIDAKRFWDLLNTPAFWQTKK